MKRPASASSQEPRALLQLDQLPDVGPRTIRALVESFGTAEGALSAPSRLFTQVAGSAAARARGDREVARVVDEALERAGRLGMRLLTWSDSAYPEALLRLDDPPPVLFLRGRAELLGEGGVSVVGSRRCTARAKDLARRLGRALGRAGVPVVSGMALGVDGAAHRGALEAGGVTVAVVGRGADAAYPSSHRRLFEDIVEHGLVVSEFLPGTLPLPFHFPRRNRIMAALSESVVVVEAGARSGALITVKHALDVGLDVWAVPGPIDTRACDGSNQLLADGALPLVAIERFVEGVGGVAGVRSGAEAGVETEGAGNPEETPGRSERTRLAEPERRLLRSLDAGPLHVDELAAAAGLDVPLALALLVRLELDGAVEQMPGFHFRAA
ncbi:MAG: DNA-processing protein DprA [Gemmatimonadota bacterium]